MTSPPDARASGRADRGDPARRYGLLDLNQRDGVDQTVGQHEVAVWRDIGLAHDVAATGDHPSLELLRLRVEAHHRIGRCSGLAVPDDVLDGRYAVRLGFRPAGRRPLLDLPRVRVEPADEAAREVRVPNDVVAGEGHAA